MRYFRGSIAGRLLADDRSNGKSSPLIYGYDRESDNLPPLVLDVKQLWPVTQADAISVNTAHIMDWEAVKMMFDGVGRVLSAGGYFCLYGPVNMNGQFTSPSNESFDMSLRMRDPAMGIRTEDLQRLGSENHLEFVQLHSMPANNVTMVWKKAT